MRRYWLILLLLAGPVQAATHDVLVLYTQRSATRWTAAGVESRATSNVSVTNSIYAAGAIPIVLRVVGIVPSPVQESATGGMVGTLTAYRTNASVMALRVQYGADMVMLVSEDTGWCGYSHLSILSINGVTTVEAYSVMNSGCDAITFAHEIGHLQGLDHNIEDTTVTPAYPYGRGFRVCAINGFRDIMSYACPGLSVAQLAQFSDPTKTYNGYAIGTATANAAQALRDNAAFVASYMAAKTVNPVPRAPTNLTVH